jgi:hypothetical protein
MEWAVGDTDARLLDQTRQPSAIPQSVQSAISEGDAPSHQGPRPAATEKGCRGSRFVTKDYV